MPQSLPIKRLDPSASLPVYASLGAAGADLRACLKEAMTLRPGSKVLIPTGLAMAIPRGYEVQIRPRSGLAFRHGVTVLNSPGTIDADYRGELKILLINHGTEDFEIEHGMRIAQMVVARCEQLEFSSVSELDDTSRGSGGFGSTGKS